MARLFMTGFEMGAIPMTNAKAAPDLVSSNMRTGAYAMRIDSNGEGAYIQLPATVTELYARVAWRPTAYVSYRTKSIMYFRNSSDRAMLMLGAFTESNTLAIYRNDGNWTQLAVGPLLLSDTWYVLEVHVTQPANSGGVFQVKVNGTLGIDFTGDTLGSQTPADFRYVGLGETTDGTTPHNDEARGLFDDFAVNDASGDSNNSWPGRGGIEALRPAGAGATTQLTPSAGANWDCVDEVPASDADYVGAETVDLFDTYTLGDTVQTGGVPAVAVWLRAALAEAGAGSVAPVVRSGGTDYTGSDKGIDTTYRYMSQIYETNPATAAPWTTAELDGIEAGAKVR